jgi:uncharacterized protein YjeT (DUF2065 family)
MTGLFELGRYLFAAFALCLVLEGVLPFLNPARSIRIFAALARADPERLRWLAFRYMVLGAVLLWIARP